MDYPVFFDGPMKMEAGAYYSQIGLDYLAFPVSGFWASRLARQTQSASSRPAGFRCWRLAGIEAEQGALALY